MIYLVSKQQQLFNVEEYSTMTVEDSLALMKDWEVVQLDTETTGRDPHLCDLLCVQFGNDKADARIVVDTSTVDIKLYKEILETKLCILQNAKFDLQFFFNYGIIIRKVYDTMIVEQLLHLGYPPNVISYSLASIAYDRLGINVDKTVRGEIIWRGLDERVLIYAAGDVTYLEKIMASQIEDLKKQGLIKAAKVENRAVPSIAYLEWCGIHLDEDKWKDKMKKDLLSLKEAEDALNKFVTSNAKYFKYTQINRQGSLFDGFDTEPKCTINWSSSRQVVEFAKLLGFNVQVKDKKSGKDKESVLEKHLSAQKGINDGFLKLYFDYQEHSKVVSSFGQGHLNAINPKTGRLHTTYRQLGTSSGRMACGSQQPNTDLAKFKGIPAKDCTYPNMQQLPHDEITRACFTAEKNNLFVSCDYSAQEGRVQGDIYQDQAILKMYREGIDGHSMYAKIFFKEELKDIDVHDVAKLRPDLRSKAKGPEFGLAYGCGFNTIMTMLKCSAEEALQIIDNYEKGFSGTAEFAKRGADFVKKNGYIMMCKETGHKMYWWDHNKWLERQKSFTPEFWEKYKEVKKQWNDSGPHDFWEQRPEILDEVSSHFGAASKWCRLARNAPPQGTSAVMTKTATTNIFNWIVDNGYFGKILCCALVHDETNWEFPKEVSEFPKIVQQKMEESAALYCKSLPIPAKAEVGEYWIH